MDQLFRRAAENYPLDTSLPDWDKVAAGLAVEPPSASRNKSLLWLVLLVPLTLMCNRFMKPGVPERIAVSPLSHPVQDSTDRTAATRSENVIPSPMVGATVLPRQQIIRQALNSKYSAVQSIATTRVAGALQPATVSSLLVPVSRFAQGPFAVSGNALWPLLPASRQLPDLLPETPAKAIKSSHTKGWYIGAMAGLDATSIRLQEIRRTGYDLGIVAGYQLNNKVSLELTAAEGRKYYYTQGKYYNTKGLYMPANSEITDVTGQCRMYEASLGIKWRPSGRQVKGLEFGAALNSYLMAKEDYRYTYYYGGSGTSAVHPRSYSPMAFTPLAAVQLSAGFYHQVLNRSTLHITPFIKIPLSKMGSGEMPFYSTGVRLSVTRTLKK